MKQTLTVEGGGRPVGKTSRPFNRTNSLPSTSVDSLRHIEPMPLISMGRLLTSNERFVFENNEFVQSWYLRHVVMSQQY